MGHAFSSKKDYNRALAKQPRKSIALAKIDTSCVQQEPLIGTLSIPFPVRNFDSTENIPESLDPSSPTTDQSFPIPTHAESPEQQQPELDSVGSPSCSISFPSPAPSRAMNNSEPTIIRRSVVSLNKHHRANNSQLTSYTPRPAIVERNGKQFMTEVRERMERRYVQIYDELLGQMRLFEVTDYIPTKTVRFYQQNSPSPMQGNIPRQILSARPALPMPANAPAPSTNLLDFQNLNNRETVDREFDLYHRGIALPVASQNNANNPPSGSESQDYTGTSYTDPSSRGYESAKTPVPQRPTEYSPSSYKSENRSYRQHSPTTSDYSGTADDARSISENSDMHSINRSLTPTHYRTRPHHTDPNKPYRTVNGEYSSAELDPFAKTVRTGGHPYMHRAGKNNYSEPMQNSRGFPGTGNSDYAPLAPNRSSRKDSNVYDG